MTIMQQRLRMKKPDEMPIKYSQSDKSLSKKKIIFKHAFFLGEQSPPICSSPATQRVGGKDRSMSSLEEVELLTDVIFSLNRRDMGRWSLCFMGNTPRVFPKNRACNKDTEQISGGEHGRCASRKHLGEFIFWRSELNRRKLCLVSKLN